MISAWVMQINEWLLKQRAASPEELPAFPSTADGGSRAILQQATAAAAAAAEPPAAVKGSARPPGKPMQASTASARKSKDTGDPSLYSSPMHEEKVASTGFCSMARSTQTNVQHCFRAEKHSVCFEPATLRRQCFCKTRLSSAGNQAAMADDMPRLSCPDLAAATVRWQQVWEDREEAGAGLGTVLPCCCLERTPIMQQCILIAIKQEGTRGLHLESACMARQEPCNT